MDGSTSILTIAVAFFVGSALTQFFTAIVRDVINPPIAAALSATGAGKGGFVVKAGNVAFDIGDLIASAGNLIVALLVVSFTLPYIRAYAPIGGRR